MIKTKKSIAFILTLCTLILTFTVSAFAADTITVSALICPVCGKIYGSADSVVAIDAYNTCLDGHRNANGYFQCTSCDKEFDNPTNYVIHKNLHEGIPYNGEGNNSSDTSALICPICEKIYGRADSSAAIEAYDTCLDSHRQASGYYTCPDCGETFDNPETYVAHERREALQITEEDQSQEQSFFGRIIEAIKSYFESIVDFFKTLFKL